MQTWQEFRALQPLATNIILNSIERKRVSHAYLLHGMKGTGKRELALLLAKTILCGSRQGSEPCQTCPVCQRVASGNHPDVHWIEPDGHFIKNDQIKSLRKEFSYTGYESPRKIYIISDAETLYVNAANRILKFLEEPDQETTAILLTNNGQRILPTIRSRCQIIDFQPLNETAFQHRLMALTETTITENNARLLSALTNNIDEALTYHQEEKMYQIRDLVKELLFVLLSQHHERYLFIHQKWLPLLKEKKELEQGLDLLLMALKDVIDFQIGREDKTVLFQRGDGFLERAADEFSKKKLLQMSKSVLEAKQKLQQNIHPTLMLEQLVLQF